ncbi:AmmeMemoRadiSam system protein A [Marinobacterium sp. AK62]|uniref:AmmeMemoRadiSam system protein A n=1 Tax=Marinobacterium alkalitolerans TaxID=1542925 RepID=A0ABS3ZBG8_9GAMM|nr:AmmeMemoRadiSam system protein A [Marinobacterium alkalitolerans]MBP0049045.1 AmmeMemoRadiSam system protein A [Marinobacterium alkalitolerans]
MSAIEASHCKRILGLARQAIATALAGKPVSGIDTSSGSDGLLDERLACFVTLESEGRLRGCIGSLQPNRRLAEEIVHNAIQAALHDPRFLPLSPDEPVRIQVSVLSPLEPLAFASEAELLEQLRPGRDGLLISQGIAQSTFLPDVWRHFGAPQAFLQALKQKGGMRLEETDASTLRAWRYTTRCCEEASEKPVGC